MLYAKERLLAIIRESECQAPQVYEETIRYFLKCSMERRWQAEYAKERFKIGQEAYRQQGGGRK